MSIKPPVVITESIIGVLDDSDNDDSSVKSTGGFVHVGVIISCSMWWVWSYGETRSRDAGIMPSYGPIIIPHMGLLLSPHNTHIRPFVVCFHPFNALQWKTKSPLGSSSPTDRCSLIKSWRKNDQEWRDQMRRRYRGFNCGEGGAEMEIDKKAVRSDAFGTEGGF